MKRSPLNSASPGGRPYGARHAPYNWKSPGGSCGRGYLPAEDNNYQRFPASGAGSQPCDGDFIPLDVSTPMKGTTTQHDKFNPSNRYSPSGGSRGSPGSGWYNFKGNYYSSPRSNCGNRYPAYQYCPKFRGQKRKDYKGAHRQVNISAYVDINSFLEDPWEDLVKKLDNSKDMSKSEGLESESLSNSKLTADSTEISGSKLLKAMNLDESQCSQEHINASSIDVSFKEQNTDLSQTSKANTSVESEIGDTCSDQNSPNKSTYSVNDKSCGAMQEKNSIHLNASLTDTDQKDI